MKRVAVINDLSGFGRCSLTAALPVLAVMGIEACPLPTAVLTNQTGYDTFYCDDYTEKIDVFSHHWEKLGKRFDGISTGYLANEAQIEKISEFIQKFKKDNTLLLVDPVMADGGKIYSTYTEKLCNGVKHLSMQADVITPNLTELCILTDSDYHSITSHRCDSGYLDIIADTAERLLNKKVKAVAVTGIEYDNCIYNGVFTENSRFYSRTPLFEASFSGTGDLFSAVVFGALINGESINNAVEKATRFIESSINATADELKNADYNPNEGVNFERCLGMLCKTCQKNGER